MGYRKVIGLIKLIFSVMNFVISWTTSILKISMVSKFTKIISREKGIWVSYGVGVYDITSLIDKHGTPEVKILLAAGMALDPFWEDEEMAKIHSKPYIPGMMEKCRIGNLKKTQVE